jgi:uncharacterized protein YutD
VAQQDDFITDPDSDEAVIEAASGSLGAIFADDDQDEQEPISDADEAVIGAASESLGDIAEGFVPESPEIAEDEALEPIQLPDEPLDISAKKVEEAQQAYVESIYDELYGDGRNGLTESEALQRTDEIVGTYDFVVGDQPGSGILPSRLAPLTTSVPTADIFRQQIEYTKNNKNQPTLNPKFKDLGGQSPDTLMTIESARAANLVDENDNLKDVREIFGFEINNEDLRNLSLSAGATLAARGAAKGIQMGRVGGLPGMAGGAVAGLILGGLQGLGLGTGGSIVALSYLDKPDDYSATDFTIDSVKRLYTNLGIPDDAADFITLQSESTRKETVSDVVALAEKLRIPEAQQFAEKYSLQDDQVFSDVIQQAVDQYESDLKQQNFPSEMQDLGDILTVDLLFNDDAADIRGRELVEQTNNAFFKDLIDLQTRITEHPEYKDARGVVREDLLEAKKYELDIESRYQKPTDSDAQLRKVFERVASETLDESEKHDEFRSLLSQLSYDDIHPELRKEVPSLEAFKEIARLVPPSHSLMTSDFDPNVINAIRLVHSESQDDQVQQSLNRVPIGVFDQRVFKSVIENTIPSNDEIDAWAKKSIEKYEARGGRAGPIWERTGLGLMMDKAESDEIGVYFQRSTLANILNYAGVVPTGLSEAEIGVSSEQLEPLFERIGLPGGLYLPTPAGIDRMIELGIRPPDADFYSRTDARLKTMTGGFQVGYVEIARRLGYNPGDGAYNRLQALGFFLDSFLNLEKHMIKYTGKVSRATLNTPSALKQFTGAPQGFKYRSAKEALLSGVVDRGSSDPSVRHNSMIQEMALDMQLQGRNILDPSEKLITPAELELFRRIALLSDRDPELYITASAVASDDVMAVQNTSRQIIRQVDSNDIAALRMSPQYRRIEDEVQGVVDQGLITSRDKQQFMSILEHQSFRLALQPDTPFISAIDVLADLSVTVDRQPRAHARFMGVKPNVDDADVDAPATVRLISNNEDPDVRQARRNGVPLGYFEYDQQTGRSIINLFRNGDLDTLWHENGHFMATLMGTDWSQRLVQFFDHTAGPNGVRVLSDLGHEQFADAWTYYRRVKDAPNGVVRRLFDELWINLHNLYSRLRRKPGLLPKDVRKYWDVEFGTLPNDIRTVNALSAKVLRKRPYVIKVDAGARERISKSKPARQSREMVAKEPSMNPEVLHQYFGDKFQTTVETFRDPGAPQPRRIPTRKYADTSDDALEFVRKAVAYIKTEQFRKDIGGIKTTPIGTGRYIVPVYRQKIILETVRQRMVNAVGTLMDNLDKRIFQREFNRTAEGYTAITDRDRLPDYVTTNDLRAFGERMRLRHAGPDRLVAEKIPATEFFVLTDDEQAGLRTLIQEMAKEPASDILPISLLDPSANLRILALDEYNSIHAILADIEAGPLNRVTRNKSDPGIINNFSNALKRNEFGKLIADKINKVSKLFINDKPRLNKQNANPDYVEIFEQYYRRLAKAPEEVIRDLDSAKKGDNFVSFFKNQVSLLNPVVPLASVRKLFDIVETIEGLKGRMDDDARASMRQATITGKDFPEGFDPITTGGGSVDLKYIFSKVNDIQDLLDGPYGMTALERKAITLLRKLSRVAELDEKQRISLADAISILHIGLLEKQQYVNDTGLQVFKLALGVPGQIENIGLTSTQVRDIYTAYYTGDLLKIYDIGATKSLIPMEMDVAKTLFGKNATSQDIDNISLLTNVLVYGKMADIRYGLARELAEAGYDTSRRNLVQKVDLNEAPRIDRLKYIDRVAYYIDAELRFQDKLILAKQSGALGVPAQPGKELFGVLDTPNSEHPDTTVISNFDKAAKGEASKIIDQMGLRRELGVYKSLRLGDETFLLPEAAIQGLEEAFNEIYQKPVRFKRNFGKGSVEYELVGDHTPIQIQAYRDSIDIIKRAVELNPLNPRVFYSVLLIGAAPFPMVPYFMSVFMGNLSQMHLGSGVRAAIADGVQFLPTVSQIAVSKAVDVEVDFIAGVMARTFGNGHHKPITKPLVLPDGRVLTADFVANGVDRFGLKQAFVDVIKNKNVHDAILEKFGRQNPWVGGSVIGGTIGGLLAGPAGVLGGAATAVTLATLLKRGGPLSKMQRAFSETATAIDTYFRLRLLVKELKEGSTLPQASRRVRDVVLDYSDLSDVEKQYIKKFFAFWTYFSQAGKLYYKSLIENPDRVLTQLKLSRSTQMAATTDKEGQFQDPELVLAPWDRTRTFLPFKIGNHAVRMPFLIVNDMTGLHVDLINSIPGFVGEQEATIARRNFLQRVDPFVLQAFTAATETDVSMGIPLSRATNQVPALMVQLDIDLFGGPLGDYLGLEYIPYGDIKQTYDEKTGRRINLNNLEMPGRGIYVATKPMRANLLLNFVQYPFTGRMLDNLVAIDRSNIGLVEAMVAASDEYYQADTERPLLARVPGLVEMGLVKAKREKFRVIDGEIQEVVRPTDASDPSIAPDVAGYLDTATGRRSIRESYDYRGSENLKYRLGYRDFYPLELGKFLGFSYVHVQDGTRNVNRKNKQFIKELKEKTNE